MKKIIAMGIAVLITGCSNNHYAFMDDAVVGDINGRTLVMFPIGNDQYRPQFASDCPPYYWVKIVLALVAVSSTDTA